MKNSHTSRRTADGESAIVDFESPRPLRYAEFIRRANRFVVEVELSNSSPSLPPAGSASASVQRTTASLPNPGRLGEILLPGTALTLTPGPVDGKHPWRVVSAAVSLVGSEDSRKETVFLDTGATNRVARALLHVRGIPALKEYTVERSEIPLPGTRSRVDFLLRREVPLHEDSRAAIQNRSCLRPSRADTSRIASLRIAGEIRYLEVKSCTLFNGRFAMFPDAATDRGRRHVEELAASGGGAVLIVVHTDRCDLFVPDFHTDLEFSRSLFAARRRMPIIPIGVRWSPNGSIVAVRTDISIPWECVERFLDDCGYYLVLLHLAADRTITTGALGPIHYRRGWYLYVGSARRGLTARINRHRRKGRKKKHWHIDYFREVCEWVGAFPIREPAPVAANPGRVDPEYSHPEENDREEEIAAAFEVLADQVVPRFGASDSPRASHLFRFQEDPRLSRRFVEILFHQRRVALERCLTATAPG